MSESPPSEAQGGVVTEPTTSGKGDQPPPKKHRAKKNHHTPSSSASVAVRRVIDGDTLELADGRRIRLVQIDTPELGERECYSRKAAATLGTLAPPGSSIRLESDPALDQVDHYGRLLRYIVRGSVNVNLELVRRGAASVWFYDGDRGRYADELLRAAEQAKQARLGAWGACAAELDPRNAFSTMSKHNDRHTIVPSGQGCEPGYDPCLPITDDLDCGDVAALGLAPVRVSGSDRYRLDGDRDGVGCE